MIKDIAEDLLLIGLLILAGFLAWKFYFRDLLLSGVDATKKAAAVYVADVKTTTGAVLSPWDTLADIWKSNTTAYISQADQAAAIAKIKAQLAGKQG